MTTEERLERHHQILQRLETEVAKLRYDYNKMWEEGLLPTNGRQTPQPTYEILAFRATEKNPMRGEIVPANKDHLASQMKSVESGQYEYYRVMRLSDGKVWQLGDETTRGKITAFKVINDFMWSYVDGKHLQLFYLEPLAPARDWEVLKMSRFPLKVRVADGKITICDLQIQTFTVEEALQQGFTIDVVEFLPTGEVWAVGDDTNYGPIDKFDIREGVMFIDCNARRALLTELTRPTTYTTADGVKVKEGEKVWWYDKGLMDFGVNEHMNPPYYSTPAAVLESLSHEQLLEWSKKQLK